MLTEGVRPPEEFIRPEIVDYLLSEKNIFID
jgi:ATP sulfurylase